MTRLSTILASALIVTSAPIAAQDFSMPGTSPMDLSGIQSATLSAHIGNLALGQVARGGGRGGAAVPRIVRSATGGTAYRAGPALARSAVSGYVQRISRSNPQAAKHVAGQFARHDYRSIYRGLISGTGLREDDALDALTAYTALNWMISNNAFADPNPGALRSLRAQLAPRFAGTPAFANPGTRAALGEELKLLFITLHAGWQSARKEGNLPQYSRSVAQLFQRQGGADLTRVKLGPDGFSR